MHKFLLYWHTVKNMKPSQVYYRIRKLMKLKTTLGVRPTPMPVYSELRFMDAIPELNYDPVFLERFPTEDVLNGKLTFLHEREQFDGNGKWEFSNHTPLWNFNLHYFEFLFSLVKKYQETKNEIYLNTYKNYITGWIQNNTKAEAGPGWSAYTISLRLVNWLESYMELREDLEKDMVFSELMMNSVYEQYAFLAEHLEKDLLGNHYFENLKTLVICSVFFGDDRLLKAALKDLKIQCAEQILPDGMHFELSPMYHKIILEDVLRVAVVLRKAGKTDLELERYLQSMLDVAYSFEEGLERVPLFNDGGNNVAKSLTALLNTGRIYFGITPQYKPHLTSSGYYFFKQDDWKLIVDAGQPGPKYIPGHAHCDAMSFELFKAGKPILVNCGTYAYQCKERSFFRSTAAHNTVQVEGVEQSQCWSVFRVAKHCRVDVLDVQENRIKMRMTDYQGNRLYREIRMDSTLSIHDECPGKQIVSYIHSTDDTVLGDRMCDAVDVSYAYEYGALETAATLILKQKNSGNFELYL